MRNSTFTFLVILSMSCFSCGPIPAERTSSGDPDTTVITDTDESITGTKAKSKPKPKPKPKPEPKSDLKEITNSESPSDDTMRCLEGESQDKEALKRGCPPKFSEGDYVRVKRSVTSPAYGWGAVSHSSVGTFRSHSSDDRVIVDFPEQSGWFAKVDELEATSPPPTPSGPSLSIGTYVSRGPDWQWGMQDGGPGGVGVVISEVGSDKWVDVRWADGSTNNYRWGKDGKYDLKIESSFRPRPFKRGDRVKVKHSVSSPKYGWGSVTHSSCGSFREYDSDGDPVVDFPEQSGWHAAPDELEPCGGRPVHRDLPIGTIVKRGPDWQWGMQDGGAGGKGTVISAIDEDMWVDVRWADGSTNNYRWGAEGAYDLEIVGGAQVFSRGDKVKVKHSISSPKYGWGSVTHASCGTFREYDSDGDPVVDFPEQSGWHAAPDELEYCSSPGGRSEPDPCAEGGLFCEKRFQKGQQVRVKRSISTPRYGWGAIDHNSVGLISSYDGKDVIIDFPDQKGWRCLEDEIEISTNR